MADPGGGGGWQGGGWQGGGWQGGQAQPPQQPYPQQQQQPYPQQQQQPYPQQQQQPYPQQQQAYPQQPQQQQQAYPQQPQQQQPYPQQPQQPYPQQPQQPQPGPAGDAIQSFHASGIYHQRAPLAHILADVERLRSHDSEVETRLKKNRGASCLLWVLFLASAFATTIIWPLGILAVILFVTAVIFSVRWSRAAKLDLENRRYELAARLLELLGRDSDWQQPVQAYLDLRPADHPSKLKNQYERSPWTIKSYEDRWLALHGTLGDGTRYTLSAIERKTVRSGWKRGSSGKLKHKTKSKSKHRFANELRVRTKKHPQIDHLAARGRGAVQLPHPAQPKKLSCKKGVLRLEASLPVEWDEGTGKIPQLAGMAVPRASVLFAAMLLSCYQIVGASKELGKRAKG